MRKLLSIALAVSVTLAMSAAWATDPPSGPVTVTNFGKKAPVTFDHAKHKGDKLTCASCHHQQGEGKYKCGSCHKAEAEGAAVKFQDAAHAKDVGKCWGCHRAEDAAKKLKCNDCHKE